MEACGFLYAAHAGAKCHALRCMVCLARPVTLCMFRAGASRFTFQLAALLVGVCMGCILDAMLIRAPQPRLAWLLPRSVWTARAPRAPQAASTLPSPVRGPAQS